MPDETGRRGFFKEALNQLIQPVAEFLDDRISDPLPAEEPSNRPLFRPPGALPEVGILGDMSSVW